MDLNLESLLYKGAFTAKTINLVDLIILIYDFNVNSFLYVYIIFARVYKVHAHERFKLLLSKCACARVN